VFSVRYELDFYILEEVQALEGSYYLITEHYYLSLGFPNVLFHSGFPFYFYVPFFCFMHAAWLAYIILRNFVTVIIFDQEHKLFI
jgi:hypothetical protein